MFIVTGEPRSGTSLMMETLRLLGIPVWGSEQPSSQALEKKLEKEGRTELTLEEKLRQEKAEWMNDKFWELGGIVMRGIQLSRMVSNKIELESSVLPTPEKERQARLIDNFLKEYEKHKNDAIKIIWNGLMKTDREILETSKIILCLRNPYHIAKSQTKLETQVQVAKKIGDEEVFQSTGLPFSPFRYLNSASQFVSWLQHPMNSKLNILKIDYDDMHFNTEATIRKIADFVGCKSMPRVKEAMCNIDPNRRRSADFDPPTEFKQEWMLVQEIYEALHDGDFELITSLLEDYNEFQRVNPENAKWLDEETFFPMNVGLYRDMLEKPELKAKMQKSKKAREQSGLICTHCPLYNRNGELYTVELPSDLDNIERNKVKCVELNEEVTLEDCQRHWQSIQFNPNKLKTKVEIRNFRHGG